MSCGDPTARSEIPSSDSLLSPASAVFPESNASDFGGIFASVRRVFADGSLLFGIASLAIWMLSRPFEGIDGDARIYLARALADLDPAGVGRDMMFVLDGQSQFSIFSLLTDRLVAVFNPGGAAFIFALLNVICWLTGAHVFISRFAKGRIAWAIVLIVAALPSFYGPFHMLRFAEQYAIPRPLAEACVLAGLAFLIDERRALALLFLVVAAAFHPIMALPGFLIFGIDLCRLDRRWIAAGFGLGCAGLAAAALGVPLIERLTTLIDPEWLALLRIRNPYLFPALWPSEPYGYLALQFATIVLVLDLVASRIRFIFLAVASVGIFGVLLASLFGDVWPVLLVVQAQLWRTTWLMSVVAAISLALCLLNLRQRETRFELASAFIVLGWLFYDEPVLTIGTALIALAFYRLRDVSGSISRTTLNIIWALVVLIGLLSRYPAVIAFCKYVAAKPTDYHATFSLLWSIGILSMPIAAFAIVWVHQKQWIPLKAISLFAALAAVSAFFFWDDRQLARQVTDQGQHSPDLTRLFPSDHSEIYWMGGTQPWYLLGHPSWALQIQGAGIVFSRPLAMQWQERVKTLMALNFMDGSELAPWATPVRNERFQLKPAAVDQLCARSDAPSTIVAPMEEGTPAPTTLKFKTWQPSVPEFWLSQEGDAVTWHRLARYIVVSCADHKLEQHISTR